MQRSLSPQQILRCRPGSGESDASAFTSNGPTLQRPALSTLSPTNSVTSRTSSMQTSPVSTAESRKDPAQARLGTVQELMNTRRQLRAQQAANKKLQEQVLCYEKEVEALRSNFSVSQSQASIAKVSTEINSKAMGSLCHEVAKLQADRAQLEDLLAQEARELREVYNERDNLQSQVDALNAEITELRDAKAENERQTALLSKELQDTKDILHMRNAVLHHNQCDQQAAHAEISALQDACDSLKATLAKMHTAHAAAEREVAILKEARKHREEELQREVSALLGKLEAQGRELAELQHHQTQARQLTATLHSTTDALEKSQAELQQTASSMESTQQQLAQVEAQLAEARAACLGLQDSQARKKGSLVFRLIRGGLSILAAALALQQVSQHLAEKQAAEKQEKGIRVLNWRISFSKA
ncbi:g1523 [Coccomyxa viridis]|uniref:G1523 protein n=1 Tax=Coccomyxa viridis TaxID=1274662 RepID=A0ABP1FKA6_9CHLO